MNYPYFQKHSEFEVKTEYDEAECLQYFPFLENGFYRLEDASSLFLIRIAGYGAIIKVLHEEELENLEIHSNCSLNIKSLPVHIAQLFETQVQFHPRIAEIMAALRRKVEMEGFRPELN